MNETITRSAGAQHGQETSPTQMEAMIRAAGRIPVQRTTLYGAVSEERRRASFAAAPLAEIVNTPARRYQRELSAGAAE
jgi:FO synthase